MFQSYTIHSNVQPKVETDINKTVCSLISCSFVLVIELKGVV